MRTEHHAVESVVDLGATDTVHSQRIALGEARLRVEYGIGARTTLALLGSLRVVDTSVRYLDPASRDDLALASPDIHHRNERLWGLTDPWLLGGRTFAWDALSIDARAGLSLALAQTQDDPFALGDMGLSHQHIQFGTGTWNPILGVDVRYQRRRWALQGFGLTQQVFYENAKGYRAGDRYAAGLFIASPLGTQRFTFAVGPEVQAESAERWRGIVRTDEGNQGRIDVLGTGRVTFQIGAGFAVNAALRARAYTRVVGGQLSYPAIMELGVSKVFGGR